MGESSLSSPTAIAFHFPVVPDLDQNLVVVVRHPDSFSQSLDGPDFAFAVKNIRILELQEPMFQRSVRYLQTALSSFGADERALVMAAEELTGVTTHDLMTGFQFIAADCEFGGVQRALGSDHLGLFRFAGASPETAIQGLDCRFEGIGEDLDPYVAEHGDREWIMKDVRYNLGYHTRMSENEVSRDRVIIAERRKVAFLRRRLLEELEEHQKIFVCADCLNSPPAAMLPFFLALSRYDPNTLQWITQATQDNEVGRVDEIVPGLMRGNTDRFTPHQPGQLPSMHRWLSTLANAWLLHHGCSHRASGFPA